MINRVVDVGTFDIVDMDMFARLDGGFCPTNRHAEFDDLRAHGNGDECDLVAERDRIPDRELSILDLKADAWSNVGCNNADIVAVRQTDR